MGDVDARARRVDALTGRERVLWHSPSTTVNTSLGTMLGLCRRQTTYLEIRKERLARCAMRRLCNVAVEPATRMVRRAPAYTDEPITQIECLAYAPKIRLPLSCAPCHRPTARCLEPRGALWLRVDVWDDRVCILSRLKV
jgi:hypothetical protein